MINLGRYSLVESGDFAEKFYQQKHKKTFDAIQKDVEERLQELAPDKTFDVRVRLTIELIEKYE